MQAFRFCILGLFALVLTQCSPKKERIQVDPAFSEYISAYTTGIVSVYSPIKIRFTKAIAKSEQSQLNVKDFVIQPQVDGSIAWEDDYTLVFQAKQAMAQNQYYKVTFPLTKIYASVPDSLAQFVFDFHTIKQDFEVRIFDVKTYDKKDLTKLKVTAEINLADRADLSILQNMFQAQQNNKNYTLSHWRMGTNTTQYFFEIDSVARLEQESVLHIVYDGKPLGVDKKDQLDYTIPALGDFKVIHHRIQPDNDQQIVLQFSDPLLETQDLQGLIEVSDMSSRLSFSIKENEVTVFLPHKIQGNHTIYVHPGVQNCMQYKTSKIQELTLEFESLKPNVELLGEGVIVPNSQGLILPFRAVSLRAVNVKIIQVFENNVAQFLQVNSMNENYELRRVGKLAYQGSVKLQGNKGLNLNNYHAYTLDLAKLITPQPGAIYHVELSFNQSQSIYACQDGIQGKNEGMQEIEEEWNTYSETQASGWDGIEDYYEEYYDEDYDYSQRDNPCHSTYYKQYDRKKSRNVFSSNMGIIAKKGADASLYTFVTDLLSTQAMSGVKMEVYNYQHQLLGSGFTDASGMAKINLKINETPYLLKAIRGDDRGYLRLDEGSSLSVSMFDVAGEITQKGLKGFIYGERGVWRPGDTLFLSFIVEDKGHALTDKHPAVLELINPMGQLYTKEVNKNPAYPFYTYKIKTNASDPTGNWTAKIKMGGAVFTKNIKIETIKPNRLKIDLQFKNEMVQAGEDFSAQLTAAWLHGAVAKNLKTDISANLKPVKTQFSRFKEFEFDNPYKTFESEEINVFEGNLNQEGVAQVKGSIQVESEAPGMLQAQFITRVYEEGGDFSIDQFSSTVSPYMSYVGLKMPKGDRERGMLLTDVKHKIEVVTVDEKGKSVSRENVTVDIYKISWQWWWENSGNEFSSYREGELREKISSGIVSTDKNGIGNYTFEIKYPDWGRYFVVITDPISGHSSGKIFYADWPGWAGRAQKQNDAGATMLRFSLDKEKYKIGEKAKVTFPSSAGARALVSLENGLGVLQATWVEASKDFTTYEVEVTPEMSPNVYIHITLVQPHANTKNDRPIRLYGMMPMLVEDASKKLLPKLTLPEVIRPQETYTVKVGEQTGRKMTYTLAIVDEGLLGLTRFKTPDPYNHFYAREALGVKSWDMYQYVLGALSGEMTSLLATGGDGEIINKNAEKAQRFKPVVKFIGPFTLEAGKTNLHKITLPPYIGAVRTMVVAAQDEAYGFAEKTTPVKKPLMLHMTAPRVLSINETVDLPVTVFAMDKKIKDVRIDISSNDFVQVVGQTQQNAQFKAVGDQVLDFRLKTAAKIGICKLTVKASSGTETASETIELDVRPPNVSMTKTTEYMLQGKEQKDFSYELFGIPGSNQAVLEFSSVPPLNLERHLRYLIQYPHGCIEQTTSSVFPQLYLNALTELSDAQKTNITQNIKKGIERLQSFQTSEGGFAYWPGELSSNTWGTNYALHFLLEAEKKGYVLPSLLKSRALEYQKKMAKTWRMRSAEYSYLDFDQAYRLYTLALAGQADFPSMNRMMEQISLDNMSKWKLAAAYLLAGQKTAAEKLLSKANTKEYSTNYWYSYGSDLRDEAMMLECLNLQKNTSSAKTLLDKISENMRKNEWMSTQTTAYCLLSIAQFLDKNQPSGQMQATLIIEDKTVEIKSSKPIFKYTVAKPAKGKKFKVVNQSSGTLFINAVLSGIPAQQKEEAYSKALRLSVDYSVDVQKIKQGTDFEAIVRVDNTGEVGSLKEIALTQVFPSGWEITNTRFLETEKANRKIDYQDIRDDRVYSYFDLPAGESITVRVKLHASYKGRYYMPATSVEAMYDHNARANNVGTWVEVVE